MNTPDFHGHGFLPPSIKLPTSWIPVHGVEAGLVVVAPPHPTVGVMLQPGAGDVMRRPDLMGHT